MKLNNFWLMKAGEKKLLNIIEWAQKNHIRVENLTYSEIRQAIKYEPTSPTHYKKTAE